MNAIGSHIRAGVLGGLGGGAVISGLDLALVPASDRSLVLVLVLSATLLCAAALAGAGLGLCLALLRAAGRGLGRLVHRPAWEAGLCGLILAVAMLPALKLLVRQLASGRQAAELLGPLPIRAGLVAAGCLLCGAVIWAALRLGRGLTRRGAARLLCLAAGVALLGAAAALFWADASLFRRLYAYLHQILMVLYMISAGLGFLCLLRGLQRSGEGTPERRHWREGLALAAVLAVVLGGGLWARNSLQSDQRLRFSALELTSASAKVLALVPLERVEDAAPLFLEGRAASSRRKRSAARHTVADANVVLVSIDALRADHLGTYGYKRPTSPNIDRLVRSAVRFESAYCQAPLTCYSIPSMHTGDYLKSTLPLLSKSPPTLAQILGARGYTTAAFFNESIFFCDDKKATAYGARRFGFGHAETELRQADQLTNSVLRYLQQHRASGKRKLFLWVHYFDVHEPYHDHVEANYGPRPMDRYDAEIAFVDAEVGRLIASLHQLRGPTIFVLTSDHGEEFKEHGGNYHGSSLYEEQIRVPLIIAVPGLKPTVVRSPAQLVDIAPTLLELLGIRVPESVRGRSLLPELMGQGDPDRAAFSEVHTKKMVRWRHWKLIHDFRRSTFELYDLLTDAAERVNLIGRRPRETGHLKSLLHGWFDRLRGIGGAREEDRPEGIDLGRIGDRRAVPLLSKLVTDPRARSKWRQEAARLLGQLQDRGAADALWTAAADDDRQVAEEAAIALGEMKDKRARIVLPRTIANTDAGLRMRAAIALARVDSPKATPALIEAMYSGNWEIQNRAAHYLGFIGDKRAIKPLLRLSRHLHLRSRIALALGRIGRRHRDPRIMRFLLGLVGSDGHADVRQRALGGLGFLGDRRAVAPLARYLNTDPDLTWTPETLSRLGGLGGWWAPGIDFSPARRGLKDGWGRCTRETSMSSDNYLGQTHCATQALRAGVQFNLGRRPFPAWLQIRLRPLQTALKGAKLSVSVNGRRLAPVRLTSGWTRLRLNTRARLWRQGRNDVRFALDARADRHGRAGQGLLAFDYLVLVDQRKPRKQRTSRP